MRKMRTLPAAMMVAAGSVLGAFAVHAEPRGPGTVPEPTGTSMVIQAHEPAMAAHQCIWFKGCKYCRACVECQWMLQYYKKGY
jgi:hypothetical protein